MTTRSKLNSALTTQSWPTAILGSRKATIHHIGRFQDTHLPPNDVHRNLRDSHRSQSTLVLSALRAFPPVRPIASRFGQAGSLNLFSGFSKFNEGMGCSRIDGAAIANTIKQRLHAHIQKAQQLNPAYRPSLKILQIGDRPDSTRYIRMKLKAAEETNILCELIHLPTSVAEPALLQIIHNLNDDCSVHAILVQLPLPDHLSEHAVTSAISEIKDVDGLRTTNIGELAKRRGRPRFVPCTPKGVMVLLTESGVDPRGKHAVVLGRSDIVGNPVSYMLKNADATVTTCHSQTQNLAAIVGLADIVVAAIGKPRYVQGEWLKKGAVVIDVGTNYVPDSSKKSGWGVVGDVDHESAIKVASRITPVPGGVGPMTVAMLLQNVVEAATSQLANDEA